MGQKLAPDKPSANAPKTPQQTPVPVLTSVEELQGFARACMETFNQIDDVHKELKGKLVSVEQRLNESTALRDSVENLTKQVQLSGRSVVSLNERLAGVEGRSVGLTVKDLDALLDSLRSQVSAVETGLQEMRPRIEGLEGSMASGAENPFRVSGFTEELIRRLKERSGGTVTSPADQLQPAAKSAS